LLYVAEPEGRTPASIVSSDKDWRGFDKGACFYFTHSPSSYNRRNLCLNGGASLQRDQFFGPALPHDSERIEPIRIEKIGQWLQGNAITAGSTWRIRVRDGFAQRRRPPLPDGDVRRDERGRAPDW
jgi:hypothetical protein